MSLYSTEMLGTCRLAGLISPRESLLREIRVKRRIPELDLLARGKQVGRMHLPRVQGADRSAPRRT